MVKSGGLQLPNMNGSLALEKPISFFPINATTVLVIPALDFGDISFDPIISKVSFVLSGDPGQFTWDESGIFEVSSPPEEPQRVGNFQTKFHICQNASIIDLSLVGDFAQKKRKQTKMKIFWHHVKRCQSDQLC